MDLLTYPKTDYLLNTSLESLHVESQDWLKEIDFWKDETTFYFNLIRKKCADTNIPTPKLRELQKQVVSTLKLDAVKNRVISHERSLATLFKNVLFQEEDFYRENHKMLLKEMCDFQSQIRRFKKQVFSLYHEHH